MAGQQRRRSHRFSRGRGTAPLSAGPRGHLSLLLAFTCTVACKVKSACLSFLVSPSSFELGRSSTLERQGAKRTQRRGREILREVMPVTCASLPLHIFANLSHNAL